MLTFAFYKAPGTWRDRAIRLASWSRYSHVEFVLNGPSPILRLASCASASKRDGNKVRLTPPFAMPADRWDFLTVEGNYKAARKWALAQVKAGTPYNTTSAVLSITGWPHKSGVGMHCSDFCGCAAIAGGVQIDRPHMLTPGEFYHELEAQAGMSGVKAVAQTTITGTGGR